MDLFNKDELIQGCSNELGAELVNILYKNTNLSYNSCSKNVIEIFEHLTNKLPQLESMSKILIDSINNTLDQTYNPDALNLVENLKFLSDLKYDLENGNKNFYEVQMEIERTLNRLVQISVKSCPNIYKNALEQNREYILHIVDIWNLCTIKRYKLTLLKLFYDYFTADNTLVDVLFNNSNLIEEACFMLKEALNNKDCEAVEALSVFLIFIFANAPQLSLNYKDFLNKDEVFIELLLNSIEDEVYLKEIENLDYRISQHFESDTIQDLLICLFISLNNHFVIPNENLLLEYFLKQANHDSLLNKLLQLFNFEDEPLSKFKLEKTTLNETFSMNSVIKVLSDLFSNRNTANLFHLSEFNLLIDVIVRQLRNLSSDDQIRMEYISLIDLIIRNSEYLEKNYRTEEIKECFKSIINEKIETLDQDIVRLLYASFPYLKIQE